MIVHEQVSEVERDWCFILINTTYNNLCLYGILARHVYWTHKQP